ncbi:GDP-L-fucose synthase family protein [Candidatus Pelagibacter sp.]|uniref:GDP-L-fucose synthase family protein n=1 Tax=Candidatus Pelagibacter sp. TaxID=2024849 RepID=UPI003F865649
MQLNKLSRIFLAGHRGMVGSSILRTFRKKGYKNIFFKNSKSLDLKDQKKTYKYLKKIKPEFVIIAAAKVGGILANNNYKAQFIYENLMIQSNLIHSSYLVGVKKLIFLGSSCIYPKHSKQPISEKYLLTGKLEKTNEAYAIAKIAGIKMCEAYNQQYNTNYICLMPTNLYGPNDNYDLKNSHFFPALIKKIFIAKSKKKKSITLWGDGTPMRELMYVDDLADACEFFLKKKTNSTLINIGSGIEKTILEYTNFLLKNIGINLKINFDKKKPNGTPRKKLNCYLAKKYGWKPKTNLIDGLKITYEDFLKNERFK